MSLSQGSAGDLRAACEALMAAARELAATPTVASFDKVAQTCDAVEALRVPVLASLDRVRLIDEVLDIVRDHPRLYEELGDEGIQRLRGMWEEAALTAAEPSELTTAIAGMRSSLPGELQAWDRQIARMEELERALDETKGGRDRRRWRAEHAEAHSLASSLWSRVEVAISPKGQTFAAHDSDLQDAGDQSQRQEIKGEAKRDDSPTVPEEAAEVPQVSDDALAAQDLPQLEGPPKPHVTSTTNAPEPEVLVPNSSSVADEQRDDIAQLESPATSQESSVATPADSQPAEQRPVIWLALEQKHIGIAYHLARLGVHGVSADLLAALALAKYIGSPQSPLAQRYEEHLSKVSDLHGSDVADKDALALLLFGATAQPALFAPGTSALQRLQGLQWESPLAQVAAVATRVASHCQRLQQVGLDIHGVPLLLDGEELKRQIDECRGAVNEALQAAKLHRFRFTPVARVWQSWLRPGGFIHEIDEAVSKPPTKSGLLRIEELTSHYTNEKKFMSYVHETNGKTKNRSSDIDKNAVNDLRHSLEDLMIRVEALSELMGTQLARRPDFVNRTLAALAGDLRVAVKNWEKDTKSFFESASANSRIALAYAKGAIVRLADIFARNIKDKEIFEADAVLSSDVLLIPEASVDIDGHIEDDDIALEVLLRYPEGCSTTLEDAFGERCRRRDVVGAHLTAKWMDLVSDPAWEDSQDALDQLVTEERGQVEGTKKRLIAGVESAYVRGQIDRGARDKLAALVLDRPGESMASLVRVLNRYQRIESSLTEAQDRVSAELREQIAHIEGMTDEGGKLLLEAALDGNAVVVHEVLARARKGEAVTHTVDDSVDHLEAFLAVAPKIVSDQLSIQKSKGGKPSNLIEPWYALARRNKSVEKHLASLFTALGFDAVRVELKDGTNFGVKARPLMDRGLCPSYQYGSSAAGRYEVILNHGAGADSLMQSMPDARGQVVSIMLHFDHLGDDRRWLREWSNERGQRVIILDETLLLYLSTVTTGRLRAFFDCTLAFAFIDPFVTTASLLPPELFFGRAREREGIMDAYGSCFVYGGRQIGKTALLRAAEAAFHRPAEGHIARWIDLKANEIGLEKDPGAVWEVLWGQLERAGVIAHGTKAPSGRPALLDRLRTLVEDWMKKDSDRRLLLLLDEADAFLELDARSDFIESTRLKAIMESSSRRFKVVFSGLHNVLRTTERANHPLAHFGEPICVGPLLDGGDWQEALALVREPLWAMGCRFDSDAPVLQILAQTNYYPSLIQLIGAELARYVREMRHGVPYVVSVESVGDLLRRGTVRDAIRQRFQLTLQLDNRYEVIAYAMAFELGDSDRDHDAGLRREDIFEKVQEWWAEGFVERGTRNPMPIRSFDALLHEMVGLGVLRQVEDGTQGSRYTLRNLNILPLLGTETEIMQALERQRDVPKLFEPASFRARVKGGASRRGVLTFAQEDRLQTAGVAVIAGNVAAGIQEIPGFLDERLSQGLLRTTPRFSEPSAFEKYLNKRRPSDRRVYLVSADNPWGVPWIKAAVGALRRMQLGRLIRVAFVATPTTLWRTLEDLESEGGVGEDLDWIDILPWDRTCLERWCDDLNLGVDPLHVDSLMEKTGGWDLLLQKFDRSAAKSWESRIDDLDGVVVSEREELLRKLGLEDEVALSQMRVIMEYDGSTEEDMWGYEEIQRTEGKSKVAESALRRRLLWATRVGLVSSVGGRIEFNPVAKHVLLA